MQQGLAQKRLLMDFKKIQQENQEDFMASPQENDIFHWEAVIFGPEQTPWEGGCFELKLAFTNDYPTKPPEVKFAPPIYHPNVYPDGRICLDILKEQWTPILDVWAILTSIRSLLCDPNPNSPANPEAAKLYMSDRAEYYRRVKEQVEKTLNGIEEEK
ncbi:unnamed protein product [Paramecium primaurelia]|uniref:UBC core domain-containing protein n=2 Tax=Paramecium TaxID=5884 RepID=A0A8S1VPT8_9CILI|nr:unnamed protein product [Paramecium primaurelia]CAD8176636.1 unnamed protein product [Paramecium pentaurelia]